MCVVLCTVYRASFCQTYAEMDAPSGEWKSIVAMVLAAFGVTGWFLMFCRKYGGHISILFLYVK